MKDPQESMTANGAEAIINLDQPKPARWIASADKLSVTQRARNALKSAGLMDADGNADVAALRALDDDELIRLPNLGKHAVRELRRVFGDYVPPPAPSLQERRLLSQIQRFEERLADYANNVAAHGDPFGVAKALATHQRTLNQIAASCNWLAEHIKEVTSKSALALSDFTDFDLLSELQRRTERRQEEVRQSDQLARQREHS
jgi:hypothetical protein